MDFDEKNLAKGGTTLDERKECVRRLFARAKREVVNIEDCLLALVEDDQTLLNQVRVKLQVLDENMSQYCEKLDTATSEEDQDNIVRGVSLATQEPEASL